MTHVAGAHRRGFGRERADAELAAADDAVAGASSSLVALETHPGYELLAAGDFTGVSRRRRDETLAAVDQLHRHFALYRDAVARAHEARGSRSRPGESELAAVAAELYGESVLLSEQDVPLEHRELLGPTTTVRRATPAAVLEDMTSGFRRATGTVAAVAAVWDALVAQLAPLDRAAADLAERLPDPAGDDELAGWRARVDALRTQVWRDPLTHDPQHPAPADEVDAVRAGLDGLADRAARVTALRDDLDARVAALSAELDALDGEEAAVAGTADEVARRIRTGPELPTPTPRAPAIRAALRDAHAAAGAGQWSPAAERFDAVARELDAARRRTAADQELLRGLLDRRGELRGRLGALRVKAARRGRAEDLELDALHTTARDLLWTAPCDLAAATVAVRAYQRALETDPTGGSR